MAHPTKKTEPKICEFCKKQFSRRRYGKRLEDYSRWMTRRFCSKSCSESKTHPTHRSTYNIRARKVKKIVKCENCGGMLTLCVHHIDGNIKNNLPKNLKVLCKSCHMKLHWKFRKRGIVYNVATQV